MKKFIFFIATSIIMGISILIITNPFGCSKEYQYTSDIHEENLKKIKNVLLVIACSLRADHLSCYGYERKTSPNIDRLAKEGILFKNCFSQAPYTVHSVASIMTSKYPRKLFGINKFTNALVLPDQAKTFAEIFKEEGFYTLGFMANPWTRKRFNHHQGFDYYFDTSYLMKLYKTRRKRLANRLWGKELTSQIIDKLKEIKGNFFLQILYIDVHKPYTPFPPFKGKFMSDKQKGVKLDRYDSYIGKLVEAYDETILGFDSYIGKLVEALKELNLLDSTLIIITSDHGDAFAKFHKYDKYHGLMLYNTVIKIPLIFYNPHLSKKGVTIDNYITSMDVLPTTLDLMGISYDRERFDGISQKEFCNELVLSEKSERQIFSETNFLKNERGMRRSCIIWDQRWKLICNYETEIKNIKIPVYELYDLKNDPNEINNLFNQKKNIAENLILLLQDWQKKNTGKLQKDMIDEEYSIESIDPEIKEQLKSLGYIK